MAERKPPQDVEWDEESAEAIEWDESAAEPLDVRQDFGDAGAVARAPAPPGPESVSPEEYGPQLPPDFEVPPLSADPGWWSTVGRQLLQGYFKGGSDEAIGGITRAAVPPGTGWKQPSGDVAFLKTSGDVYRAGRDTERAALEAGREHYPKTAFAAQALGDIASDMTLRGLGVPGVGAQPYNIVMGALTGVLSSDAEMTPDAATEESVARGLAAGGLGAYAGKYAGQLGDVLGTGVAKAGGWAGRQLQRLGSGLITPTDAARYLQSLGVEGLTIGQMAPRSLLAQWEEAGTTQGLMGPALKSQREAGLGEVQQAAMREVLPPVPTVPQGRTLGEQIASIDNAFDAAYGVAKGYEISPQAVQNAMVAVDNPAVFATDATRKEVAKWLQNQMTALKLTPSSNVLSDDVIALRSSVRKLSRSTEDSQIRTLLDGVEQTITEAIDASLPDTAKAALRKTDQQYAKLRTLANAVGRAGDQPAGFTPTQLSSAVKANTPERLYEQGGGGPLREIAGAAKETLDVKIPTTGARLAAVGPVTAALAYGANLPGPKRALLGQTEWQKQLASADWLDDLARTNPEALGRWGQYLGAAASRSPEALSLAKYELGQNDEAYQQARRRQGEREP